MTRIEEEKKIKEKFNSKKYKDMKRIITNICMLFMFLGGASTASAQTGLWSGELDIQGTKLPLVFNFSADGCTMDSPKQGAKGIKANWTPNENGDVVVSIPMIGASYIGKYDGKEIKGTFKQGGAELPLNLTSGGVAKPNRPQTPVAPFPYTTEEVSFKSIDVVMNGTLTLPEGYNKKTPVVLLITGSGQQNRDEELFDHKPFAVIADALARQGIASLRCDDRGWGLQGFPFLDYTTADFKTDAENALSLLRKRFCKVGVIGHSEGGTIALMLASEGKIDYAISMAGMATSGRETLIGQNRDQLTSVGASKEIIDNYCSAISKTYDQLITGKKLEEIEEPAELPVMLKQNYHASLKVLDSNYMRYFLTIDAGKSLSKVKCPVLALNGKSDTQVNWEKNLGAIDKALVNSTHQVIALKGLNHLFQHCKTGQLTEYGEIEETISPEVLKIMTEWIKKQ